MHIKTTSIPGCYEIECDVHIDGRGQFVKTVNHDEFSSYGLESDFVEQYYSRSHAGVIRGLHFQSPPHEHAKLVYCISGTVLDAVLDLRAGSPTYGKSVMIELSSRKGNMMYVPRGLAHGFCALEESVVVYNVTSAYASQYDAGLLWNSAGIHWPFESPILSDRDRSFPAFAALQTPFQYTELHS
jgi:dTDP-4-dehydrorhamnose 3,5-epimerase